MLFLVRTFSLVYYKLVLVADQQDREVGEMPVCLHHVAGKHMRFVCNICFTALKHRSHPFPRYICGALVC
jgi:hypothetical protein